MLVYQLLVVSTFITGRTVRDTLFLRRADPSDLPFMYVVSAATVAFAGLLYSRVADRYRRDRSGTAVLSLATLTMVAIWAVIHAFPEVSVVYTVLYVLVEVLGSVCIIQFWTTANDIFTSQQSKRLFGFIGAGGVLANILCGVSVGGLSWVLGPVNLLLLNAGLFASAAVAVRVLGRLARTTLEDAVLQPKGARRTRGRVAPGHDQLLRAIGVAVAVTFLVVTLVDFQFKIAARETFAEEAALASFFGYFYGLTGIASAGVQLFLTSWILTQAGILAGLAVLPTAILAGALAWLVLPGIIVGASLMRGAENVFRYTVHDATLHLLYVPIPGNQRGRAKAFIDGVLKPGAIGACGIALMILTHYVPPIVVAEQAVWVDLFLLVLWLGIVVRIRRGYVRSLGQALEQRRLEPDSSRDLVDEDTRRVLSEALQTSSPEELLHILELIGELEIPMRSSLIRLADHPEPQVRAKALTLLEPLQSLEVKPVALARIEDVDPNVRAAAVRTLCAIDRDGVQTATRLLNDGSRRVRAAAVVAVARYGDFEGLLSAARTLEGLLFSADEHDREAGASIISDVRWADFFRTILRLLNDPSVAVRRAAIRAAGRIGTSDVLLPLIHQLADDEVASAAVQALVGLGPDAQPALIKVLNQPQEDLRIRRRVPRVLAAWGDREAYDTLVHALTTRDPELRTACGRAAARIRENHPSYPLDLKAWTVALDGELRGIARDKKRADQARLMQASLLAEALEDRSARRLERVGDLFVLRYPGHSIRAAFAGLGAVEVRTRSQAWELLENVLEREQFHALITLLEAHEHLSSAPPVLVETRDLGSGDAEIRQLAKEPAGWVAAVAIDWLGRNGHREDGDLVRERTEARDPLLRETALYALRELIERWPDTEAEFLRVIQRAVSDRSDRVSATAQHLLQSQDTLRSA
jgi:AAA family ATP:ADP antiporter